MSDISNKALALFLLTAMIVSLGGFLVTFNQMDRMGITGRATSTDSGLTNFTINSSTSIIFTVRTADFGQGLVNTTGSGCVLNTSNAGPNTLMTNNCTGFYASVPDLQIRNEGTQNVTLNVSFNTTAATFIGGTGPNFTFYVTNQEAPGSCSPLYQNYNKTGDANDGATHVAAAFGNFTVCNSTGFNWNGQRTMNLSLGIRIPIDALSGTRAVSITALGYN